MGLSTSLEWSRVVSVVHTVLLPGVHLIRLVGILVGGRPCTTAACLQQARDTPCNSPLAPHLQACSSLDSYSFYCCTVLPNCAKPLKETDRKCQTACILSRCSSKPLSTSQWTDQVGGAYRNWMMDSPSCRSHVGSFQTWEADIRHILQNKRLAQIET